MTLEAVSDPRDADRGVLRILLRIKGDATVRNRVKAVFAIDVSPSMDGDRIFFAKYSVIKAIESLEPGDGVAIVPFCRTAWIAYKDASIDKASTRKAVKTVASLKTCYGTNIEAGLATASRALRELGEGAGALILVTDGEPNTGSRDPEKLARLVDKGVAFIAVGVGSEYNEELLASIAERSSGRMTHVSEPEDLDKPILEEVTRAARLVASRLRIIITPPEDASLRVLGWTANTTGNGVELELGSLSSGEVLDIGLVLESSSMSGALGFEVTYTSPNGTSERSILSIPLRELMGPEEAEYAGYRISLLEALEGVKEAIRGRDYRRAYEMIRQAAEATLSLGDEGLYEETIDIAELIRRGEAREASKKIYSTMFKARRERHDEA